VKDLDMETGKEILQNWLSKANRHLTKEQEDLVMKGFHSSPNPLFLKVSLTYLFQSKQVALTLFIHTS